MSSDDSSGIAADQHVRPCIAGARVRTKTWLEVDDRFAIGPGGIDLLRAIAAEGTLAGAARAVGWSYRHAWGYVRRAEALLRIRLVAPRSGKGRCRGSVLTPEAHRLIRFFDDAGRARVEAVPASSASPMS